MFDKIQKHESFGLLSIARSHSSSGEHLFGSSIAHREIITLEIYTATVDRDLNQDWFHQDKSIIRIEMSPTQFAEAITTLNSGSGVPVTIKRIEGKRMSDCPFESKIQQFNNEFEQKMKEIGIKFNETLNKISDILKKPNISKKELKALQHDIEMLRQEIKDNVPFINTQFSRQMDMTISEAKGQIEAYITNIIHQTGLKHLKDSAPMLEDQTKKQTK